eukprot:TRINITY_DN28939_c0_g1_i1.p1 TRINITY_DN28939_c0_g1~~TRINITY_DN28939_c0_g1_i1.p1  ORF type:complete len:863 (-),score=184.75 TRINITY_DN28939_c0_g1_i1:8-2365(-)
MGALESEANGGVPLHSRSPCRSPIGFCNGEAQPSRSPSKRLSDDDDAFGVPKRKKSVVSNTSGGSGAKRLSGAAGGAGSANARAVAAEEQEAEEARALDETQMTVEEVLCFPGTLPAGDVVHVKASMSDATTAANGSPENNWSTPMPMASLNAVDGHVHDDGKFEPSPPDAGGPAKTCFSPKRVRNSVFSNATTTNKSLESMASFEFGEGGCFELHRNWNHFLQTAAGKSAAASRSRSANALAEHSYHHEEDANGDPEQRGPWGKRCGYLLLEPQSPKRLAFDFLGSILVVYDIFWIPLQLLEWQESDYTKVMAWVVRWFWTTDLVLNFFTSYFTADGMINGDFRSVARRYMRTWFPIDFVVVASDWLEVLAFAFADALSIARFFKVFRTIRVLRMIRLVRAFKVGGLAGHILQRVFSERTLLLGEILKAVFGMVTVAHFLACCWCGLGMDRGSGDARTWIFEEGWSVQEHGKLYVLSYHWAVAAFTGTSITLGYNLMEHTYATLSMVIGFVLSAAFVSSVTTAMTRLQMLGVVEQRRFAELRRYLHNQGLPSRLVVRITNNAKFAVDRQRHLIQEKDVELLGLVSEPLLIELHFELYAHILQDSHPLFAFYMIVNPEAVKTLCHQAMSLVTASRGDVIFHLRERPLKGQMRVLMGGDFSYITEAKVIPIAEVGCVIAEATMWTRRWYHYGTMIANCESRLLSVDAQKFHEVASGDILEGDSSHPAQYARFFVDTLNNLDASVCSDLLPKFGLPDEFQERLTEEKEKLRLSLSMNRLSFSSWEGA